MNNIQKLKNWWGVAQPSRTLLFFHFLTTTLPYIISVIQAVPAAKAITCITIADYKGTMFWLIVTFLLTLISQISWTFQYKIAASELGYIYPRIQERMFHKIFNADDINFKYTSKEKMINIIANNITVLSDFCDYICIKSAYFLQSVITFVIIFSTNLYIGLLILGIAIIVFFLINAVNNSIGKKTQNVQEIRDSLTETFTDVVEGRTLSTDLNLEKELHEKYFDKVDKLLTTYKKRIGLQCLRDKWIYVLYTFIILLATLYLVTLVQADTITTTTYLILTPYLTSAITQIVASFQIFNDLQNVNISALRVKTILDMSEKDMIEFGKNSTDKIDGAITFTNVSYTLDDKLDKSLGEINNFNAQITKNQIVLFEGKRNCGKRALFYILRRAIRPDSGTVTFDTINIYDFDVETYKHNISYVTNKPYFFNDSIMENLRYIEKNKKKIFEVCKKLNIHDIITALPDGYQTNLIKNPSALNLQNKFLLGLARALLTKSEIFMIYEFPVGLNENEQQTIKNILNELKHERTIIIFSALNTVEEIVDRHFVLSSKNIQEIKK